MALSITQGAKAPTYTPEQMETMLRHNAVELAQLARVASQRDATLKDERERWEQSNAIAKLIRMNKEAAEAKKAAEAQTRELLEQYATATNATGTVLDGLFQIQQRQDVSVSDEAAVINWIIANAPFLAAQVLKIDGAALKSLIVNNPVLKSMPAEITTKPTTAIQWKKLEALKPAPLPVIAFKDQFERSLSAEERIAISISLMDGADWVYINAGGDHDTDRLEWNSSRSLMLPSDKAVWVVGHVLQDDEIISLCMSISAEGTAPYPYETVLYTVGVAEDVEDPSVLYDWFHRIVVITPEMTKAAMDEYPDVPPDETVFTAEDRALIEEYMIDGLDLFGRESNYLWWGISEYQVEMLCWYKVTPEIINAMIEKARSLNRSLGAIWTPFRETTPFSLPNSNQRYLLTTRKLEMAQIWKSQQSPKDSSPSDDTGF